MWSSALGGTSCARPVRAEETLDLDLDLDLGLVRIGGGRSELPVLRDRVLNISAGRL
ncbi:hypothetical protein [Streptomyces collinus]|uniref:hypothetical protein n=1 Tax=Streptomyces collinus TaxID=42684 RepID=UPI0004042F98|nr:hypothetical protein [Streptomyces collinus]